MGKDLRKAWSWVPTLYFAQGLPYTVVMSLAVIFYKRMGLSNTEIALYTGWLYLPWVIKPLWSPLVDILRRKRWWIVVMQSLMAVCFAGIAFSIPTPFYLQISLAFFWLLAFASATHDIAADGFYLLGLTEGEQSFFVGIRNTVYRLSSIFVQGALVALAGFMEEGILFPSLKGEIAQVWSYTFMVPAILLGTLWLYHSRLLPRPSNDYSSWQGSQGVKLFLKEFGQTFVTYFQQPHMRILLFFILFYRLGEAQLVKLTSPFMLDSVEAGGIALTTAQVGIVYGTFGVVALLLGGILGGIVVSRDGLKRWLIPMALAINVPDLLYLYMAYVQTTSLGGVIACVVIEQLGYGFGFSAYMLVLIYAARGKHQTAHYAIGTGLMALGMMIPGMFAGWIQDHIGYTLFFLWVVITTLPGIVASWRVKGIIGDDFGKREK